GDPPARDLRPPGARWPHRRPRGERLAGRPAAGRARWPAGAARRWAAQLRAARARRGAPAVAGAPLRRGGRGRQQTAAVSPGTHQPAVLRHRPPSLRDDRVPGGVLADRRPGVGGRAPHPPAYRRAWFHAISDSTRDDLVRRGVPRERIEVIYPGVDAVWYAPDPGEPRAH